MSQPVSAITRQSGVPHQNDLHATFTAGLAAARDPNNGDLPPLVARATTIYSPWHTRTCPQCCHKFREADRVRLCPLCGQAYHDDTQYHLDCWPQHFAAGRVCKRSGYDPIAERHLQGCAYRWSGTLPDAGAFSPQDAAQAPRLALVTAQFLCGLEAIWKPFGDASVHEVQRGDAIVGHRCHWCRYQVRAGDRVVQCPCGQCETYFHNDVFRHLTCWNDWHGRRGHRYCPTTGTRLSDEDGAPA